MAVEIPIPNRAAAEHADMPSRAAARTRLRRSSLKARGILPPTKTMESEIGLQRNPHSDSTFNRRALGWFCLFLESETLAEVSYRLRRQEWGQGLASEGAAALINWGFETAGYEKVVACTMTVNHGSRRVMEKIGMRHVRTVPVDADHLPGSDLGEVWYELTRFEGNGSQVLASSTAKTLVQVFCSVATQTPSTT